jgi:hypothetical protein
MRSYVFLLALLCCLLLTPLVAQAFTLQTHARVSIVPYVEVQQMDPGDRSGDPGLPTADWAAIWEADEQTVNFAIDGPAGLCVNVSWSDLDPQLTMPAPLAAAEVEHGPTGDLYLTYPLDGDAPAPQPAVRSILLCLQYE